MSKYNHRRGFTIVELLVVLGIIMLLAGMLFPVVSKAQRAGQRVACFNNLRQLGAAFTLYVDDHDELFPDTGNIMLWMGRQWRPVIEPYVGNRQTYWCPADITAKYKFESTSYAYLQTFYHRPEDIVPAQQVGFYTCGAKTEAQPLGKVAYPTKKILLFEWTTNHEQPLRTIWDDNGLHAALFVDSHAALVRQEQLNTSVLGNHDPNWTVGGITGKDVE